MRVVLLQDIPNVGKKYNTKEVASGFAANFLFPKGLAEKATRRKLEQLKTLQAEREIEEKIQKELLDKNFDSLKSVSIQISAKANEEGHLYQGIHKEDIIAALKEQVRVDLPAYFIELEQPVKEIGEHKIKVSSGENTASFFLAVNKEV